MAQAIAIGGAALKAGGSIFGGIAQKKAAYAEADQLDSFAGNERAMSQRDAMEQRRQARLVQSRAQAVAAASGGGVDDPSIVNLMANIEGEGEYRALTSLYNGESEAQAYEAQGRARRKEGRNAKIAGYINAASTLLGAGSSLSQRYG